MTNRIISIICLIAMVVSMTTLGALSASSAEVYWIDKEPAQNVDYSFAVLGDIQTITYEDTHKGTRYVATLFEWLLRNQKSRRIAYVFGLGDTVETLTCYPENYNPSENNPREWELASSKINMLRGVIPYSIVRGNHDDEGGYHKYICNDYYVSQMEEFYYNPDLPDGEGNSMSNSYRKIDIWGHKYLMLSLDYNITDGVKEWANQIISENPDHHVIVSIHAFLFKSGNIWNGTIEHAGINPTEQVPAYFDGQGLWDDVLSQHENVFMILSGHVSVPDPVIRTMTGEHGNEVLQILVNPQEEDVMDPSGMVFMINIKEGGAKIEFEYLSTARTTKQYLKASNQYEITTPGNALPIVSVPPLETKPSTSRTTVEISTTTRAPRSTKEKTKYETPVSEEEQNSSGGVRCSGSITSTITAVCVIGTSLSAFAMRKRKDD